MLVEPVREYSLASVLRRSCLRFLRAIRIISDGSSATKNCVQAKIQDKEKLNKYVIQHQLSTGNRKSMVQYRTDYAVLNTKPAEKSSR